MKKQITDTSSKRRILIVNTGALFREGLTHILNAEKDLAVCGETGDGLEAVRLAAHVKPQIALVDMALEGMGGLELTKTLRKRFPSLRILVLSLQKELLHAERALRAGAHGFIMKRVSGKELLAAIRHVLSGQTYVSEAVNEYLLEKIANPKADESPEERLSDRELEIFRFIGQGYGSRQIADALHISIKTVEFHRESIRTKLHLKSTFELVQRAIHWAFHEKDLS